MSNSSNVTIRQPPDGVDRPLSYEELDLNFQELKSVIDDHNDHVSSNQSHEADSITFDVTGSAYTSTDVQGALLEVQTNLEDHISDTDAHSASDITYDSTSASFTSSDVQDAITQVDTIINQHIDSNSAHDGSDISFSGTSGLSATSVSQAIDETNSSLTSHIDSTSAHNANVIIYDPANSSLTDTDVQASIDSLDSNLVSHIDSTSAHDAVDLAYSGTLSQTNIKTALDYLADKLDTHYGQLNVTSNTTTIAATANSSSDLDNDADYVQIAGIYDAIPHGENNKISQGTDLLTIDRDGVYRIEIWATVTTSTSNTNIGFKFAENGTITLGRKIWGRVGTSGDNINISGYGIHSFTAGEDISLWITSDDNTDITIQDLVFSITEITSI